MKNKLFNVFFYLFFFCMINREFNPFGIDLRIFAFALGIILLFLKFVKKEGKIKFKKVDYFIVAFFSISILTNFVWYSNGLVINDDAFKVIFVSYVFNFLSYIVFKLYQDKITLKKFNNAMIFSTLVLFFSMICAWIGIDIQGILMSGCRGYVGDLSKNFLGGTYRYSGYAEDPNYASLFFVFAFATHFYKSKKCKTKKNYLLLSIYLLGFLLSASKTVLVAIIPALIMVYLSDYKFSKYLKLFWTPAIILIPVFMVVSKINLFNSMITMSQRFSMWNHAINLFKQSPIIGSGLTSFRSYANVHGWWYVQCHSTIFQMLSETGIVSLILITFIFTTYLFKKNKYLTFMICLFTIYMITTETAYHIYFVFIFAILPIIVERCELNGKSKRIRS